VLEYGSVVWDPYLTRDIDKLERIQRNGARFITVDYKRRHEGAPYWQFSQYVFTILNLQTTGFLDMGFLLLVEVLSCLGYIGSWIYLWCLWHSTSSQWFACPIYVPTLLKRKMRVVIEGEQSNKAVVKSGVPQGTVLGPLLFICHILYLPECVYGFSVTCWGIVLSRLHRQLDLPLMLMT
jgi:hypothetical protein